jgi:predicted acetyltransferase
MCIRENDNRLVGMIDIRHMLNDYLKSFGGHIGFSIRKSERRKGYAKEQLRMALLECKKLNLNQVLITCDKDNAASRKVIISMNGVFENEVYDKFDNTITQRYWIQTESN